MTPGARVYVVQDSGRYSFSKAERFGKLIPMLRRDVFPDDHEARVEAIRGIFKHMMKDFNPAMDSLLLTGDPVAIALAVLVLSIHTLDIPVLKYDREADDYYRVQLTA